jgi:hypothetical protein
MNDSQRHSRRRLHGEELEPKYCPADVAFAAHELACCAAQGAVSVYAADLDGDGDVDVLSASYSNDKIAWYENTDGKGTFGRQKVITTNVDSAKLVHAADLDGDGDVDVLSASYSDDKIAWYENTDGKGTFAPQRVITTSADGARSAYASDVDGDGDNDVVIAGYFLTSKIAWYENMDGKGTFGNQRVIATVPANSVYASDVDGDSDVDVVVSASLDQVIAWYENTDGRGTFGGQRVITTRVEGASSVYAADADGDGDIDVLSAASTRIAWHENTDGKGTFGNQRIISGASQATDVYATDMDGDRDVDVLSSSSVLGDSKIAWYENTDGKGKFGSQQVIARPAGAEPAAIHAADVDGDGNVDVLSASYKPYTIAWYENTDGEGTFGSQRVIATKALDDAKSVYTSDVDGDSDVDVLVASTDGITWYENLTPHRLVGDSNGDGVFNSSDLVFVFQGGKYEDGIPKNATFEEGDWNGDGDFDSSDLVLAFQEGHYVAAARLATQSIAAIDWLFAHDINKRKTRTFVLSSLPADGNTGEANP